MPDIDNTIAARPTYSAPDLGTATQNTNQLVKFIQNAQDMGQDAALRGIYADPNNLDDKGMLTPDAMRKVYAIDPRKGAAVNTNQLNTRAKDQEAALLTSKIFNQKLKYREESSLVDAKLVYDDAIAKGMTPEAAKQLAQHTWTQKRDEMVGSGLWSRDEAHNNIPLGFDPASIPLDNERLAEIKARQQKALEWQAERGDKDAKLELERQKAAEEARHHKAEEETSRLKTGDAYPIGMEPAGSNSGGTSQPTPDSGPASLPTAATPPAAPPAPLVNNLSVAARPTVPQGAASAPAGAAPAAPSVNALRPAITGAPAALTRPPAPVAPATAPVPPVPAVLGSGGPVQPPAAPPVPGGAPPGPQSPAPVAVAGPGAPTGTPTAPQNLTPQEVSALHGDDYLKVVAAREPQQVAIIKGVAEGRLEVPPRAMNDPKWRKIIASVYQYDPTYDYADPGARRRELIKLTSGKGADNITAINTAIQHSDELQKAADGLGNYGGIRTPLNYVKNAVKSATGDPAITRFNTARQAFSDELERVSRQAGGSQKEIDEWHKNFDAASSPEQLNAAIHEGRALAGRIHAVEDEAQRGALGAKFRIGPLFSKRTQDILAQLDNEDKPKDKGDKPTGSSASSPAKDNDATPKNPFPEHPEARYNDKDGKWYIPQGGGWVMLGRKS